MLQNSNRRVDISLFWGRNGFTYKVIFEICLKNRIMKEKKARKTEILNEGTACIKM